MVPKNQSVKLQPPPLEEGTTQSTRQFKKQQGLKLKRSLVHCGSGQRGLHDIIKDKEYIEAEWRGNASKRNGDNDFSGDHEAQNTDSVKVGGQAVQQRFDNQFIVLPEVSFTCFASQSSPSYSPSPVEAQVACTCQSRCRMLEKPSLSAISAADMA